MRPARLRAAAREDTGGPGLAWIGGALLVAAVPLAFDPRGCRKRGPPGQTSWLDENLSLKRAIKARTARMLRDMMKLVVSDGTGHRAAIEGAEIAGKTGTAERLLEPGKRSNPAIATDAWFVALAPAERTRLVVAYLPGAGVGGERAAPLVRDVLISSRLEATGIPRTYVLDGYGGLHAFASGGRGVRASGRRPARSTSSHRPGGGCGAPSGSRGGTSPAPWRRTPRRTPSPPGSRAGRRRGCAARRPSPPAFRCRGSG